MSKQNLRLAGAPPDLVILDFDGTIADSAPWFFSVFNDVAARHGFRQVTEEEGQALRSKGTREIIAHLGISPWRLPLIARDMRRRNSQATGITMFPGMADLLGALKARGIAVATVSSNAEDNIRRVLGASATHIDHFLCGSGLFGKAAKFRRVMGGYPPARVLAVGDEIRDIEAARQAGIACVAVTWGYAAEDALRAAGPDAVANTVAGLRGVILPDDISM
jgi:phosphoglycolate phosphatase